jgi:hypothetical protein
MMKKTWRPACPKSGMRWSAEEGAEVDEEQDDVGADADRPGPDPALHAVPRGDDADEDADDLETVDLVAADGDGPVDEPLEEVAARGVRGGESADHGVRPSEFDCARTNSGDVAHRDPRGPRKASTRHTRSTCCLPSGLSPSVPEFHRSTAGWLRAGRGLSPPVRNYTDPGARGPVCNNRGGMPRARPCAAGHPTPPHRHGHTSQPTTPIPVVRCEICR